MRNAYEVIPGVFAETHFSAANICDRIGELFAYFDIDERSFQIYLREDRNA